MTGIQEQQLQKVRNKIKEIRTILDDVMYRMMPLPDGEFKKVRDCYDLICKANDKI